jgi:hypothetical protein
LNVEAKEKKEGTLIILAEASGTFFRFSWLCPFQQLPKTEFAPDAAPKQLYFPITVHAVGHPCDRPLC